MTILNAFGIFIVRAAEKYNYNAEWKPFRGHEFVTKMTDDDAESFIKKQKAIMVFFYDRTCPHCAKIKPEWAMAAEQLATRASGVHLAAIEFNLYPLTAQKYKIKRLPGIYLFRNGSLKEKYEGKETVVEFVAYALKLKV